MNFPMSGPVEVDEVYIGGKRKNMSNSKRKELKETDRGATGKAAVVGMKDRVTGQVIAEVVGTTDTSTLQSFVNHNALEGATLYTDEALAYRGMVKFKHEAVKHSTSEFIRDKAHTNGIESFWSLLKRGYHGTFHHEQKSGYVSIISCWKLAPVQYHFVLKEAVGFIASCIRV